MQVGIFALAALLEGVYSTLVFVAAERMASRTRRKLFHNLLRQVFAPVGLTGRSQVDALPYVDLERTSDNTEVDNP